VVVSAERARAVAQIGLELHQRAVADLFQRLQLDPAPGGFHGSGQVTRAPPRRAQQIAQVHALALEF
jgi:hypothetical protein